VVFVRLVKIGYLGRFCRIIDFYFNLCCAFGVVGRSDGEKKIANWKDVQFY